MLVLWSKGFEATSIADLTKVMGIGPQPVCAFGDKNELFLFAMECYLQRCRACALLGAGKCAERTRGDSNDPYFVPESAVRTRLDAC
jgi:AcrR family transcriptional regulator